MEHDLAEGGHTDIVNVATSLLIPYSSVMPAYVDPAILEQQVTQTHDPARTNVIALYVQPWSCRLSGCMFRHTISAKEVYLRDIQDHPVHPISLPNPPSPRPGPHELEF